MECNSLHFFSWLFECAPFLWGNYEGPVFYNFILYGMNTEALLGEFTIEFSYFYYYLHFLLSCISCHVFILLPHTQEKVLFCMKIWKENSSPPKWHSLKM